jgi:pyruvate kinase
MLSTIKPRNPQQILDDILALRNTVIKDGALYLNYWQMETIRHDYKISAKNLAYYIALRKHDLRLLQQELAYLGLSSLGRTESHVIQNLDAIIATLSIMVGKKNVARPNVMEFFAGQGRIRSQKRLVFGRDKSSRKVRIMVTIPTEAATDQALVHSLLTHGMNVARINCAHDNSAIWLQMIEQIRQASRDLHQPCQILMDIAGPKLRTREVKLEHKCNKDDTFYLCSDAKILQNRPGVTFEFPEIIAALQVGHRVYFDDGLIGTVVEEISTNWVKLRVNRVSPKGKWLKGDKGINLPDLELNVSPLTKKDLLDLDFIAKHADVVSYSFVQRPSDITLLQDALQQRQKRKTLPPLVLKIETQLAVSNLPHLIVQAAAKQPVAVMIARGDLAIELGFERFAEMQEEVLWICEAAHVPVIWATQVLENLAKKGIPSRAEVTDAAMAERAECVMLNKGPFILDALILLDNVLKRMQEHQSKKTARLRALKSWVNLPVQKETQGER